MSVALILRRGFSRLPGLAARALVLAALGPGAAVPAAACQWAAVDRHELVLRGEGKCLSTPAAREAFTQQLRVAIAMSERASRAAASGRAGRVGTDGTGAADGTGDPGSRSIEAHPIATFGALRAYEAKLVGKRYYGQRVEAPRF